MLASSITIAAVALSSLGGAYAQVAAWHMDTLRLLTNERLDPVVDPNRLSAHMHQIVGGSNFGASYNYADQVASSCTSASITADKSNYWMPKLYYINDDKSFIPLPAFHRFYYFLGRNSPVQPVSPFPEGLRMLVGDPMGKVSSGLSFFTCHVNADLFTGSIQQDNFNYDVPCPYGIRVETIFPTCWNGQDLYKSDGSHMSYPAGPNNRQGQCPWTHPIRVPQIMLEFTWNPSAWAPGVPTKGRLAWANGDTTGYGVHADFVNGWDTKVLETALNNTQCAGSLSARSIQSCEVFAPYYNSNPQCSPSKGQMNEPGGTNDDLVPIDTLPGCNPIWGTGAKPACTSTPAPDVSRWLGTDGSLVATGAQNKARKLPTTPGWAEIGCLKDTSTMLIGGYSFFDPAVSVTSCTAACSKAGYNYAAVGTKNSRTDCQCGTGVVEQASVFPGMCTAACPGNSKQICGGNDIHSIYYAPPGTPLVNAPLPNNTDSSYTGCYSPTGSSSLSTKITYQYQDNALTTEGCLQICANKNATWGATTAGRNCLCGVDSSLGSGYYVGQSSCSQPCGGNSSQICGMTSVYSLYNITASSYKRQTIQHPAGWQGCFNDPGMAGLTGFSWARDDMTAQQCTYGCAELGYKRAGLLFGTRCRCGDEWKGGALYPYTSCQVPCGGNSSETCGGNYITEVYDTSVNAAQLKSDIAAKPAGWSGCFANSNGAIFKDYQVYDGTLTQQRCTATCKTYGYGWVGLANGATCRCSKADPTTTNQQWPSKQYCTATCAGDAKLTCGGAGGYVDAYNMTAANSVNTTADGYKGCYSGITGLTGPTWTQSDMNNKVCQTGCKELGYSLAGNSGNACYCGNSWTKGDLIPDFRCTTQCPGNSTQICGAGYITSLWESRLGAVVPAVSQAGYLGCFTDSGSARTLTGFSYSSSAMTNSICKSTCKGKGFALAGTSGQQCFCDNVIQNGQGRTSSSMCTTACPGLTTSVCGGYYKFSVFNSSASSTTPSASASTSGVAPSASASGTTSRGCFSDLTVLNSNVYSSGYMTIDQCLSYCKSNNQAFAGIAFGNTCRCGNTAPVVNAGRASCNTPCVSNSKQLSCGGNNAMDVWPTTQTGFIDAYSLAAADSTGYMGCWQDASTRILNGTTFTTSSMTPTSCQANCAAQGYQFAGVESNNQCYCSHQVRTGMQRYGEDRCSYNCVGDKSTKCGGNWAINIYTAKGATTPSSSVSASVSVSKSASVSASQSASASVSKSASSGSSSGSASSAGSSASKSASSSAAPSSTPSSAAIEGYKGCYGLGSFVSGASASYKGSAQMTIGFCRRYCRVQGFSAAGLQDGNNCYCGTQSTLGPKQADSACTRSCAKDSTTKCGDVFLASIYDTVGAGAVALAGMPASYVGCFSDSSVRTLPDFTFTSGSMTSDICRRSCAAKGASTWGTQAGNQCYCRIAPSLPKNMITDDQCNYKCAGLATEMCGGSWKLSVYNADFQNVVDDAETSTTASSSASSSVTSSSSSSSTSSVASSVAPSSSSSSAIPSSISSSSAAPTSTSTPSSAASSAASSSASASSASSAASASTNTEVFIPVSSASSAAASSSVAAISSSSTPVSSSSESPSTSSEASSSSVAQSSSAAAASSTTPSPSPSPSPSTTTSSTSSAAPPSPTNHLGCFTDSTSASVLSQSVITCDVLTPGMCKLWCNSNNMAYAGMTNASTCGCANDITSLASAPAAQCSKSCFSDQSVKCGGEVGTYDVWRSSALVARRGIRERKMRNRMSYDVIEGGRPRHFESEKEILAYINRHLS